MQHRDTATVRNRQAELAAKGAQATLISGNRLARPRRGCVCAADPIAGERQAGSRVRLANFRHRHIISCMIGQRSLCLLLLAAGTLGAQTAPAPPRRPFCGQQPKADDRRLPSTLAPVVSRASLIGADRLSPGSTSAVPATAIDTTPLSPDQLSPREAALIDSVVAKFPGARGRSSPVADAPNVGGALAWRSAARCTGDGRRSLQAAPGAP